MKASVDSCTCDTSQPFRAVTLFRLVQPLNIFSMSSALDMSQCEIAETSSKLVHPPNEMKYHSPEEVSQLCMPSKEVRLLQSTKTCWKSRTFEVFQFSRPCEINAGRLDGPGTPGAKGFRQRPRRKGKRGKARGKEQLRGKVKVSHELHERPPEADGRSTPSRPTAARSSPTTPT